MAWLQFAIAAAILTYAATQLARYGDAIAVRTGLGSLFVGAVLLAAPTSLPELLTTMNAVRQHVPNIAAGSLLGSNMCNMFMLAVLDLVHRDSRILRGAALKHALSGSLSVLLITLVIFFTLGDIGWRIGWVGVDSLVLVAAYLASVYLIQGHAQSIAGPLATSVPAGTPSLRSGVVGFALAASALVIVTPWLVDAAAEIAVTTALGTTFVGTTMVAVATSLPELATTLAAARLGAGDMAIGNLLGSNMFNMFALGVTDFFYLDGRFFAVIDRQFLLVAAIGLLMTVIALVGNLARIERRRFLLEVDAALLVALYAGGLWMLYSRGIAP